MVRNSNTLVRAPLIRVIAAVTVCSTLSMSLPAAADSGQPGGTDVRSDAVAALHREGEAMFAAEDFAGARNAWLDAYERIAQTDETWPYRATLLALVVTAALAEYEQNGRSDRIVEVANLVQVARSSPGLPQDVDEMLDKAWRRLEPLLPPAPAPDPEPEPEPSAPPEPPPPIPRTEQAPPIEGSPSSRGGPPGVWLGAGGAMLAGGIAAAIVGSRFEPRAVGLVEGTNDSTTMPPGSTFIGEERNKGRGWIVGGSVVATLGLAAVLTGIVLRVRRSR